MQIVPLTAEPSQTLQIVLAGQNCSLEIDSLDGSDPTDPTMSTVYSWLGLTLAVGGVSITATAPCLNLKRVLINRQYLGFVGDFMFIDTQPSQGTSGQDPEWEGLGARWVLLYLEASDL